MALDGTHYAGQSGRIADDNARDNALANRAYKNVRDFGATGDGVTDDTQAILNAIAKLNGRPGTVFFPAGIYITSPITLPFGVLLLGEGYAVNVGIGRSAELTSAQQLDLSLAGSVLRLKSGSNASLIKNVLPEPRNGGFLGLQSLALDGNYQNQTGTSHGIEFTTAPLYSKDVDDAEFDMHHVVRDVFITRTLTDGINQNGRSEARWDNVQVYDAGRYGFNPSFDTWLSNCTSGRAQSDGFYLGKQSQRLTNCKSFFSGQDTSLSGAGFHVVDQRVSMGNCEAQDNSRQGLLVESARLTCFGFAADSNSRLNAGGYVGVDLYNSSYCTVTFTASERKAYSGVSGQQDAVKNTGGSYNRVVGTHSADNGATINASGYKSTSTPGTNNYIEINNTKVLGTIA